MICFFALPIFTSYNNVNLPKTNPSPSLFRLEHNSEIKFFYDSFDEDHKKNPFNNHIQPFYISGNKITVNCTRKFKFKPKNTNNKINWPSFFIASDIVFEALMANKDVDNIIHIVENMSDRNHFYNLRLIFKKFVKNFLYKQITKKKLTPIAHLFEFLAYHSYDLVYDLSNYSSYDSLDEIENLKDIVSDYIDLRIDYSCPWRIIQLYNETLYKINENNVEILDDDLSADKPASVSQENTYKDDDFDDTNLKDIYFLNEDSQDFLQGNNNDCTQRTVKSKKTRHKKKQRNQHKVAYDNNFVRLGKN
ncbi:uncharacterized protein VNE69_03369 [Vairimorpha necatrix]|uniref:Uncharacterized protein n=1 Tax=Vairimorpha necatrix TaxID=6039 RepID=A0AAX4JB40_9MICR